MEELNPLISPDRHDQPRLGTFGGVYSPVTLGMLSTMIFLRIGYTVGNNGIAYSLLQIGISFVIVILTVFSICAISTNGMIRGGGTYYMVSRTLGPELGGVIGIMLYLGQVVATSLYVISAVEVLFQNYGKYLIAGNGRWETYLYATYIAGFCLLVSLVGGRLFSRVTKVILLIAVVSVSSVVISFVFQRPMAVLIPRNNGIIYPDGHVSNVYGNFTGIKASTCRDNFNANYSADYTIPSTPWTSFGIIFAVFFTGMTGITNGANLSGELINPSYSIPVGTLVSCVSVAVLYLLLVVLTGCSCDRFLLQNNYNYMKDMNLVPWLVIMGQFATCVSASLASFFGGTRILKAIADDRIFWNIFSRVEKAVFFGNPLGSVVVSYILVQLFMLIGSLDAIAPLSTTIFLICYFALNLSCFLLDVSSAPNFRPSFKCFHWSTCVVGMSSCMCMMVVVSPLYSGICIGVFVILTLLLYARNFETGWGHIGQALIFHHVRKYLLKLDTQKYHIKFWRPHILLFVASPLKSDSVILCMNMLKKSGLFIISHVFVGDLSELSHVPLQQVDLWEKYIQKLNVKAFPELTVSSSLSEGIYHVTLLSGLGAMKPNIIALGFFTPMTSKLPLSPKFGLEDNRLYDSESTWTGIGEYISTVSRLISMEKSVCLFRNFTNFEVSGTTGDTINLWPLDFFGPKVCSDEFQTNPNISFLLQMGCVFKMAWKVGPKAKIRVFLPSGIDFLTEEKALSVLFSNLRIRAVVCWVSEEEYYSARDLLGTDGGRNLNRLLRLILENQSSVIANLIQLPKPPKCEDDYENYYGILNDLTGEIKHAILLYGNSVVTTTQF